MKPKNQWGPADEFADAIMTGVSIVFYLAMLVGLFALYVWLVESLLGRPLVVGHPWLAMGGFVLFVMAIVAALVGVYWIYATLMNWRDDARVKGR